MRKKNGLENDSSENIIRANSIIEAFTYPVYIIDAATCRIIQSNSTAKAKNINEGTDYDRVNSGRIFAEGSVGPPLSQVINTKNHVKMEYADSESGNYYDLYGYPVLDEKGKVTQVIEYSIDITEWKKSREKAEQASRFKSEFIANMSHEIRTPLNSILGFIELLFMTELDEQQKDYFETIKASSKILLGLIDDILDFSKIESGKLEIDKTKFYLRHEMESVINMFVARAHEKKIEFLYFIDPSIPEHIYGDPLRLKQILNNLLSNAVKFTPGNGKIYVEIKVIERSENFCCISFSVTDNGIGIPEDQQKKIFDSFFQGESGVSKNYGGTGLGLAISSQLVKLMGGELKVESRPGAGSRFFFEIIFDEYIGIDVFRRDYNFGKLTCYLLSRGEEDKVPLHNIEHYLKAFNIPVINTSRIEDIIKSGSRDIIFLNYVPDGHEKIEGVLSLLPDIPVILIANRLDKGQIVSMGRAVRKVIYKPLYASKILGDIMDIINDENESGYPVQDDGNKVLFTSEALVAEDNQVNQKLIYLMLKEIGVNADLANNGSEAVEKFRNKKYDIVLMDVNMPVLNGLESTAGMREIELLENRVHTPVIALTANVVKGDRELFRNSGMDDYIAKPVSMNKLYSVLFPYLKSSLKGRVIDAKQDVSRQITTENYDLPGAASELGLSADFLKKLIRQFLTGFDNSFLSISKSVRDLDFSAICGESHKLKGTAANLRIRKLADYFSELELNAGNGNKIDYEAILELIQKEFSSFKESFFRETGD